MWSRHFSKGFGLDSCNGRRLAAEGWRFETSFHNHGEGFSSLLVAIQIGKWQEISPHPSVGVIYWTLQPWLGRITWCGTSIRCGLFLVGIHEPLSCEVNGWRIYQNFHTTVVVLINEVERVELLAIISFLGLRGVKMRLDFGVKYIMIFFSICYGAQTLFIDDELRAKETTPEYQTVAKSFNLMSFKY
ncbi:hypothetical protein V6N13_049047 [Hibiscus sabdariffa]|uniref:Uncharacterized protein n=1 Tax=Hibiscus sabdariffa TaxID=183260 RepID=A0ABR2QYB9_9ROSI